MKIMIDSEVANLVKYRYDSENDETHLDFSVDYIDSSGDISTAGYVNAVGVSTHNVMAESELRGENLWLTGKGSAENRLFRFRTGGQDKSMTGDMVANKQLYYHCIKLTSATKTVYVNIPSRFPVAVISKNSFQNCIKGNKTPRQIDWYYGTDAHVIHAVYDATATDTMKVTIDTEEVTGYEGHVNGILFDYEVANN